MNQPAVELSPFVSDEIRKTTCYMCACRCGIDVHMRDGRVRYIQGNRDHPVNKGVLCAKGSAGMLHLESPARLTSPLLRIGPRGSGRFREIGWDEALGTAEKWLAETRRKDPRELAFFTGRDQSQALTGWWSQQYGTPNHSAHGGFCSVNMAAGGIYSIGGSFWEFAQPDWERARLLLMFGVAEDHDSNPIKLGLSEMRRNGARIVSVNPVRTGYSAIADTWLGIRPGTDGLLILSLIGELLRNRWVDVAALSQRTNAAWLVDQTPGPGRGLFLRDGDGKPQVRDAATGRTVPFDLPGAVPALTAGNGSGNDSASTVFELMTSKYLDGQHRPEEASRHTGISAAAIRGLAAEIARVAFEESYEIDSPWTDFRGIRHDRIVARPVAVHAMRGISAHANGFQTCRALHLLQMLIGAVDCPGGTRFKPPYPKPVENHPRPGRPGGAGETLSGPPLGYPIGPEDLLVDEQGEALRLDKAFSWEAPLAAHGKMHAAIPNAARGDPHPISVMFLYMANMAWNSSMNTPAAMEALSARGVGGEYRIPKLIVADAFWSETVAYADLVLPDTTYLERHDCISLLDRPIGEPDMIADAIRHPVVEPDRDVRPFQDVLIELGARLGLPGFVDKDGNPKWRSYAHCMATREVRPGVGPLAGWRGTDGSREGRGEPNERQLERYVEAGGFWTADIPEGARYFKHVNAEYQDWAVGIGLYDKPAPFMLQLYSEPLRRFQLAAEGHGKVLPPERLRERISENFDPLPSWIPPPETDTEEFPLSAITQRPMAMYHSWGSQNPWLRQIHAENSLYVPGAVCDRLQLNDGDWAIAESRVGRIRVRIKRMEALNPSTVWTWNAIGKRRGAWNLSNDAPEATRGFLLNHLIPDRDSDDSMSNSDPVTGQAAWFDLRIRLSKADERSDVADPADSVQGPLPGFDRRPGELTYGSEWSA